MGWQWQDGWQSNGRQSWWSNDWRNTSGSKPKSPGRRPATQSWGLWTCQCGNVQTGSQCKGCKAKWWTVDWKRTESAPGQKPSAKKEGPSHKPAEKQVLTALDEYLPKLPPGDDAHTLVEGLRDLLRGRAPAQSKRQKLKSVLDKLDYQRSRAKNIKQRLKSLEEEKLKLEKDLADADSQTKALEEEQTTLCASIGPENGEETSEEEEEEDEEEGEDDDNNPPGVLTEAQTAAPLKRLNPLYITNLLQAEIQRLRDDGRLQVGPAPGGVAIGDDDMASG